MSATHSHPRPVFGLIGSISRDGITRESGGIFSNLGGVLYQAAVLCGLGEETRLFAHLSDDLVADVDALTSDWSALRREGMVRLPGPGNTVSLNYPLQGERVEILHAAVPPLEPDVVLRGTNGLSFLIMVINSGFDMDLGAWRRVVEAAPCPVWLDIHSLTLAKVLGAPRSYRSVPEWTDWAKGSAYLQANRKEVACMLGAPEGEAGAEDISRFCRRALDLGLNAIFITLGREGARVATPSEQCRVVPSLKAEVLDTTGCGDVFCAAAASALCRGASPFEAARAGVDLASRAAETAGVRETFELALGARPRLAP